LQKYKAIDTMIHVPTLLNSVFKTGSLYNAPTAQMGYGIPNFQQAEQNLMVFNSLRQVEKSKFSIGYNPTYHTISIRFTDGRNPVNASIRIYSMTGIQLVNQPLVDSSTFLRMDQFQAGVYAVVISVDGNTETNKVIIR
jgi:hypothetical protein